MKYIFSILFTLILLQAVRSQTDYESETLRLYYEEKWDSLMVMGEKAIAEEHNYFYMYARTGTAAYKIGKFFTAAKYLEDALAQDKSNSYVLEMLFYSYINSGKTAQAALITKNMEPPWGDALIKAYHLPSLYIESGPVIIPEVKPISSITATSDKLFTERYTENDAFYLLVGWKQPFGKRVLLNSAFSYITLNKQREINIRYVDSLQGSFIVNQPELYISPTITLNRRFLVSPALRYARTQITEPIISYDSITNLYLGDPIGGSYNNVVVGGELTYSGNYISTTIGAWHLSVNKTSSVQLSSSLKVYPTGNINLYSITALNWKSARTSKPVFGSQTVGFKLLDRTWLELSATAGNLAGTVELNGQLLNNQVVESEYRLASLLIFDISSSLRIIARYQYLQNAASLYVIDNEYVLNTINYNYNKHIITGGITWTIL
jgi:hypothetical protein